MDSIEKIPPFGRWNKTTFQNSLCMAASMHAYLKVVQQQSERHLLSRAKKAKKYCQRVRDIIAQSDPHFKYPLSFENRYSLLKGVSTGIYLKEVLLNLDKIEFEMRKDFLRTFEFIMTVDVGCYNPLVEYLYEFHEQFISFAIYHYPIKDLTFCSGCLLQSFLNNEKLHKALLNVSYLDQLAGLITDSTFEVSSDAMETFMGILLHRRDNADFLAKSFIKANGAEVLGILLKMIKHENFFAKLEASKLLNQFLRDDYLTDLVNLFVSSVENLKLVMTLLLYRAQVMQLEAFEMFLLLVKECEKYPSVKRILKKNQESLVEFFHIFQCGMKEKDFHETKEVLISHLKAM